MLYDECLSFLLSAGNNCPYISDDLNEDTISVLVRLITEKKGRTEHQWMRSITRWWSVTSPQCIWNLLYDIDYSDCGQHHWLSLIWMFLCVFQKMLLHWRNCCWSTRANKWPWAKARQSSTTHTRLHTHTLRQCKPSTCSFAQRWERARQCACVSMFGCDVWFYSWTFRHWEGGNSSKVTESCWKGIY